MSKVTIELCMGTTCFVMGASGLPDFFDALPEAARSQVEVKHSPCMGLCKDQKYGKAPYVKINGEVMSEASAHRIGMKVKSLLRAQEE